MNNKVTISQQEHDKTRQDQRVNDPGAFLPPKLEVKRFYRQDWRIQFGLGVTFLWLCAGALYISGTVGWASFIDLPIAELGNFLEGAFAPVAFLWLVIGLFIQQTILAMTRTSTYLDQVMIHSME